jgi:hypothetical protein
VKHARRLSRHLDELRMVWRQIEAALDRVESARETDQVGRTKTDALLAAASALERLGITAGTVAVPLGDAVVDAVPTRGFDPVDQRDEAIADAWQPEVRVGRLPGTDEVELAVCHVATASSPFDDGPTKLPAVSDILLLPAVRLPGARSTLEAEVDGVLAPVVVPSYPGWGATVGPSKDVGLEVDSLFDLGPRHAAAVAETLEGDVVGAWSGLVTRRRLGLPDPPPLFTGAAATGAPFDAALRQRAASLLADVREGRADRLPLGAHRGVATTVAQAAAASTGSADAEALATAADALDEEGVDSEAEDLADLLRAAAAWAGDGEALEGVAQAAAHLTDVLDGTPVGLPGVPSAVRAARVEAADDLDAALTALPGGSGLPALVAVPVELGSLAQELDAVIGDRIDYPDGSLRLLRAVELGFARWWPLALRQLQLRAGARGPLTRALRRFLGTFVDDLAALVDGTPTSFGAGPLRTVQAANVGAVALVVDAPSSSQPSIDRQVEAGQIAMVDGVRPAAALVLGTAPQNEQLTLRTGPLRVSLVPPDLAPGTPGFVDAGARVAAASSSGLAAHELRRGFADENARDGLVEQAVALASQLALVAGTSVVKRGGAPIVPAPHGGSLESAPWHGRIPRLTVSLVLHGVGEHWWDRSYPNEPLPLLVRPGELLLLRGTVDAQPMAPEGAAGSPPEVVQSVVEVDRAVRLPGRLFERLDLTTTAVLAADPSRLGAIGEPPLICGHDDDLVLVTLRRSWQARPLVGPVTLRRDFAGFDVLTLAIGEGLGDTLVAEVTGSALPGPPGVDRRNELDAAVGFLHEWTRYGRS